MDGDVLKKVVAVDGLLRMVCLDAWMLNPDAGEECWRGMLVGMIILML